MKCLPALCLALFSCAAMADEAKMLPLHQAPPNVQIINGKRFFSMQNVHRFTGDANSPKALSVMHAPRPAPVINRRTTALAPVPAESSSTKPAPAGTQDQVLSIFSPEEKSPAPVAPSTK